MAANIAPKTAPSIHLTIQLPVRKLLVLLATSMALLCAGCYESRPEVGKATVTPWQDGKPQPSQDLSATQVRQLTEWLASHRWGWHPVLASYFPGTPISIVFTDGTRESANVMKSVVVLGKNQRSISASEYDELMAILRPLSN